MKKNKTKLLPILTEACILAAMAVVAFWGPLHASSVQDNSIEASVKNSYIFSTYLKDDQIDVRSNDGVVTLLGTTPDESHRRLAEDTAANEPGVKRVVNQLNVSNTQETNSDAWVATKVKMALLLHRNVDAANTRVDVNNGVVTLTGQANTPAQAQLTEKYAKNVDGVTQVNNLMTTNGINTSTPASSTLSSANNPSSRTLGEKVDDASITAQAKMALLYNRATSALRTQIDTKEGVVTIKGKARNPEEKQLVTELISDINGVRAVENQMTVLKAVGNDRT